MINFLQNVGKSLAEVQSLHVWNPQKKRSSFSKNYFEKEQSKSKKSLRNANKSNKCNVMLIKAIK